MSQALATLLDILKLEKIATNRFCGNSQDLGLPQVFGGQVVAQGLYAMTQCVPAERHIHSFHSYFLRPANCKTPIFYEVKNLRDGHSFSARQIEAIQDDQIIFYMTASFQKEENGFDHQCSMPEVIAPEMLFNETQIISKIAHRLSENVREIFTCEKPIEIRPVEPTNLLKGIVSKPNSHAWFKANGEVPDDIVTHQFLLSYASDFSLLPTALQPHGVGLLEPGVQVATIDHSMWFHRKFSLNDWLLYVVDSPSASNGRGFVRGHFYTRTGELVASTVQEGVIRRHSI